MPYGNVDSTPVVVPAPNIGQTVTLIPGPGNTSKCEYSTTETALVNPSSAVWSLWSAGVISSTASATMNGRVVALRFSRVSGSNTDQYEII